ncbi:Glycosyl hydrolase family 1 [Popillia japonica]|uniref:Glycosyl hydrolase family 1 n=1 Tax=Popillia japonica TaxID=7064 RepID=A0AAW1KML2_POPJA
MNLHIILLSLIFLSKTQAQDGNQFPGGFRFGVATASYQVEGAWNEDGKGENIWDYLTHNNPGAIDDGSNGDIACDSYHKTAEDVELLKDLDVDFYRFSISWSRILPSGHANYINREGVNYYNELIDTLIANDIRPLITMFHWDLPQPLQEIGGWPNPILADLFVDYAKVLFDEFGDRVLEWITFNEPYQICHQGYSEATKAPLYAQDGIGGYLCGHTLLLAHAKTYQLYNESYRETQQGRVGITVNAMWGEPASESEDDATAAENYIQFTFGWFFNPIYASEGDYPSVMRSQIDANSQAEGFQRSRLPSFTQEEIELLKGSSDFLGLNHYSSYECARLTTDETTPSFINDMGVSYTQPDTWEAGASFWLKVYPDGIRKLLNWIKTRYGNPEVMITENGFSYAGNEQDLQDCRRVNYYNVYLEAILAAIVEDECNVTAYTAWSFMDNYEWLRGYTQRFGLYYVDFTDDDRPRTPKMSSRVYSNIISTRAINWTYVPEGFTACDWSTE